VRRTAAAFLLIAGVLPVGLTEIVRAQETAERSSADGTGLIDQTTLPSAIELKGPRPQADSTVLPPAATTLPESLDSLQAPPSLALPDQTDQVRVRELRPLTLSEVERLAEVNNPNLKAVATQVQQAKSILRASLSRWYPTLNLRANGLPQYLAGEQQTFDQRRTEIIDPITNTPEDAGRLTNTSVWSANFGAQLNWNLIDPGRVPEIAGARDSFERARDTYLIALRDLRLEAAERYFVLQFQDDSVTIGQRSVRASLVSLRDARARYQAGVATKLEVLEAETQLSRDQQLLTDALLEQVKARRDLAALLDLPQDVTPTAASPARVVGIWEPSLQESIVAAYAFREELDRFILDISINNSNANAALAQVQPTLSIFNSFSTQRFQGETNTAPPLETQVYGWSLDNTLGLSATWNIFDGGRARAEYRRSKQRAQESEFNFATQRNTIRREVEASFFDLRANQEDIRTASREVLSATEALRLARLRFQAGVTTQREVVDNQRDLTRAQLRYVGAISDYNRSIAELRRYTGLDQVASCPTLNLPAEKPEETGVEAIPIEPAPNIPACEASQMGV
jgi:OMF family outer membrane factor